MVNLKQMTGFISSSFQIAFCLVGRINVNFIFYVLTINFMNFSFSIFSSDINLLGIKDIVIFKIALNDNYPLLSYIVLRTYYLSRTALGDL